MKRTIIPFLAEPIHLVITVYQFKQQLRLNFFAEYTKRYQDLMLQFPENIESSNFTFKDLDSQTKAQILRYMRIYFDLCSEEYFLYQRKYIDKKIWEEWETGIKMALSNKAFADAWRLIAFDTYHYPDFCRYVEKILSRTMIVS